MSFAAVHARQKLAQYIGPTVALTVDGTSHATDGAGGNPSPLAAGGRYVALCPEADVCIRQGGAGLAAVTSDSWLPQGVFSEPFNTDDLSNNRIAVTAAAGVGGVLYLTRIDSLNGTTTGTPAAHQELLDKRFWGPNLVATVGVVAVTLALAQFARYELLCPDDDCWVVQGGVGLVVPSPTLYLPRGTLFPINSDDATTDHIALKSATGNTGARFQATRIDTV
jgi:hypothetical protein